MLLRKSPAIFGFVFLFFALTFLACSAQSYKSNNWRKLGETNVDYRIDHDRLNANLRDGKFKQLKFVVRGGAINMYRCIVHFQNGETQEIDLRHTFNRGSDSRIIDLNGNERFIDFIDFWYDTKNYANQRATLVVWGK
jgi:Skp family chaperone for outer membrane proteins